MGGKVIFTKKPRDNIDEIFDREREIEQLTFLLQRNEWVIILGPRLSGKTSLAVTVSKTFNRKVIYVDLVKVKGIRDMVNRVYDAIPKNLLERISDNLESLGLRVGPVSLSIKSRPTQALEGLLRTICNETIVVFDEAQDLKQGINHLIPVFHKLLNRCPTLSIIFTGSAIGLIKTLIEQKGEKPLAGRRPSEIILSPWSMETAKEYLVMGLNECNVNYRESEIVDALNTLGTLPGWLNIYGINRCMGKAYDIAIKDTLDEAIGIALDELKNITEKKQWRKKALRMLGEGTTWSELLNKTHVSTETLSNFLNKLKRLYLIKEEGRRYFLSDPVYRKAVNFL